MKKVLWPRYTTKIIMHKKRNIFADLWFRKTNASDKKWYTVIPLP